MKSRLLALGIIATLALLPSAAWAQEAPSRPDAGSADGATAGGTTGPAAIVVDSCGHPVAPSSPAGMPALPDGTNALDPTQLDADDETSQPPNVSAVEGRLVHAEGNFLLVQSPQLPAAGNDRASGGASQFAVIRLPADCAMAPLVEGATVSAVGTPSANGVLEAQVFQEQ